MRQIRSFEFQAPYVCGVLAALLAYVLVAVVARLLVAERRARRNASATIR